MKIKKLVKLAPMMLLTFLLGLSGCSGSTTADARGNDHPSEADEELHVMTIGTADSGGTMYPIGSAIASVLSGHDEQLKVNLSASNGFLSPSVVSADGKWTNNNFTKAADFNKCPCSKTDFTWLFPGT